MKVTKIRWICCACKAILKDLNNSIKSKEEDLPCHGWSGIPEKISESTASIPWVEAWWATPQLLTNTMGTKLELNPQGTGCHRGNLSCGKIPLGLLYTNTTGHPGSTENLSCASRSHFKGKTVSFWSLPHHKKMSKHCLPWRLADSNAVCPFASPMLCQTAKSPFGTIGTAIMLWGERRVTCRSKNMWVIWSAICSCCTFSC